MGYGGWMTTTFSHTYLEVGNSEACLSQYGPRRPQVTFFLDQTTIPVNAILGVKLSQGADPIDSFDNLYFMAIARIHQVKYGPFFEHSSQLYSIATHVQSWAKVNKGLFEMYQACRPCVRLSTVLTRLLLQAEVLGKRVVVQHLPLGGLIEWDH